MGEVARKPPHSLVDGHLVVVEDHDEPGIQIPGMVQSFHGHAIEEGSVSDNRHHMMFLPQEIPGLGIAQGGGERGAAVSHVEGIEGAFGTFGISAYSPGSAKPGKTIFAIREKFIGIGLMPHIEDHAILPEVEGPKESHDELHRSQRRGQMPPVAQYRIDDGSSDILAEQGDNSRSETFHILRGMDGIQNRHGNLLH
jgi:hypothetical protein